jgi:hypothetical protein
MSKTDAIQIANALVGRGIDRKEAMFNAWRISKLKDDLRQNHRVNFKFIKKDGTIREANGTLHEVILNEYVKGTYKGRVRHDIIKYFDLDKNCFRSFDGMNLIA